MDKDKDRLWRNKRRLINHYAEFLTKLFPDLDIDRDVMEEIRKRLEKIKDEEYKITFYHVHNKITITPRKALKFINNANKEEIDMLRNAIIRRIRRIRRINEEASKIEEILRNYVKSQGIPIPIVIKDMDKLRISEEEYDYVLKIEIGTHTYLDEVLGRKPEEIAEQMKPTVDKELRIAKKLIKTAMKERTKAINEVKGLREFLDEVESHVKENAIITIAGKNLANPWDYPKEIAAALGFGIIITREIEIMKWDINRTSNKEILYGSSPTLWAKFYNWLIESLKNNETLSVILRSFLEAIDERTGLPVKEIRGYIVTYTNNTLTYQQLTAKEIMEAETTDPETGEKIHEPAVIYCGPGNDKIYSL